MDAIQLEPNGPTIRAEVSLSHFCTLEVGGRARWFTRVSSRQELEQAVEWAAGLGIPVLSVGEGSNVLFPDSGYPGLVVQISVRGIRRRDSEVEVGAGENLNLLIRRLNGWYLAGMERMYGIPGTVAGALVGNAGAYGQEICEVVTSVSVWSDFQVWELDPEGAGFRYRHSRFKEHKNWVVLSCRLRPRPAVEDLQAVSNAILEKRAVKYPPGLRCPGSFFKNVLVEEVPPQSLRRLPTGFIQFGKIPAGKLLEAVGAKGARRGGAEIAGYHANLIVNRGGATSRDILDLGAQHAERVWERFGIRLEPEIYIVDDSSGFRVQPRKEGANREPKICH